MGLTGPTREHLAQPAPAGGGAREHFQTILAELEASQQLDGLLSYLLKAIDAAYTSNDSQFPTPDCATFASAAPISELELSGSVADAVFSLLRNAADPQSNEALGYLCLRAITQPAAVDSSGFAARARQILWLECNTKLALLTLTPKLFQAQKLARMAHAIAELTHDASHIARPLSRGEQYAALVWLQSLDTALVGSLESRARQAIVPAIPDRFGGEQQALIDAQFTLTGTLAAVPRGAVATAIGAFTGWLFVRRVVDSVIRIFLAYRAKAEVRVSDKGLEIRENRSLLGRRFRERTSVVAIHDIRRLSREVRYARTGTYAGLAALGLGSFLGMRLFVDGLRVPGFSGPLLWLGLLVVVGGLCLDFALTNWLDATRGRCRFLVVTEGGKGLCLADVEAPRVDAMLAELAKQLVKTT